MAVAITLPNQKGGVGKTTFALHLSWRCQELGLRTLGIDLDPQGNYSESMVGTEVLRQLDVEDQVMDARVQNGKVEQSDACRLSYHLFDEELPAPLEPYQTHHEGLDILPAAINDDALAVKNQLPTEAVTRLAGHLASLREHYDVIVIDVPPAKGTIHLSGLIAADKVVLPVMMSAFPMRGIEGMVGTLKELSSVGVKTELLGVLVNIYNSRSNEHQEGVALLQKRLGSLLLDHKIGFRASVDTAVGGMRPVWRVGSGSGRAAAQQVRGAMDEILLRAGFENALEEERKAKAKAARAKSRQRAAKGSKAKKPTGKSTKESNQAGASKGVKA